MKTYTHHHEIRILLSQIVNALGGIVLKRLDEIDNVSYEDEVEIRTIYAPKQRVLFDIVNKNQHIKIPCLSVNMRNMRYDAQRAFNKIEGFIANAETIKGGGKFPQPVPVKFDLDCSLFCRYQRDADQFITCLFTNFYPYIVLSYKHPDLENVEVRVLLEWSQNLNFNYPSDITGSQPYRLLVDTAFTVSGWLYRNASNPYGTIYNIDARYTAVSSIIDDYDYLSAFESDITTDYRYISGRPFISNVSPDMLYMEGNGTTVTLVGNMFNDVSGLVLSANNDIFHGVETFSPFISDKNLSAVYSEFQGVSVQFDILDDHHIQFNIPKMETSGYVDVIAWSPYGAGFLKTDSIRLSGILQRPCVSGIKIFD